MRTFLQALISSLLILLLSVDKTAAESKKIGALADVSGSTARIGEDCKRHEPPSQLSYACFVALSAARQAASSGSDGRELFQALLELKHITVPDGQVLIVNREAGLHSRAYQIKDGKRKALD